MNIEELKKSIAEVEEELKHITQGDYFFCEGREASTKIEMRTEKEIIECDKCGSKKPIDKLGPDGKPILKEVVSKLDPRWDIYSCADSKCTISNNHPLYQHDHKQVMHFHRESPAIYQRHPEAMANAKFFLAARDRMKTYISALKHLIEENEKLKNVCTLGR